LRYIVGRDTNLFFLFTLYFLIYNAKSIKIRKD
jgi:hypothetical protein